MISRNMIRSMLAGGDRRSTGRSDEVAELVARHPAKVVELVECLWDTYACVCLRAADALEKASRGKAEIREAHKAELLGLFVETEQQEVRWHLAQIVPRLPLSNAERHRAAQMLQRYLEDRSSIVKTFAMQGLADLAAQDRALQPMVLQLIRALTRTGTPAMRARGRKLLGQFEQPQ